MTPEEKHNKIFDAACLIQKPHVFLDGRKFEKPGFFTRRHLRKSISLFAQCIDLFPSNWPSHLLMGKSYQALGDSDKALECMIKAWDIEPNNASILKEIGITAGQLGRHDLVIRVLAPLCEAGSDNGGLYVNYGLSLLMNNEPEKAA
jgi:tetratricopeptide (TPR) repeat protein